ncbi:MAG: hypothetical protein NDI63_08935 [Pseudobdellovibrio sp.]|nr:hypothetical protein [Pseudobdellovibrio sp.]
MSSYKTKKNQSALDFSSLDVHFVALENESASSALAAQELENFAARLYYLGHRLGRPNSKIINGDLHE